MIFPFVRRKKYKELAHKLDVVLWHATGGKLSNHTYPLKAMVTEISNHIQECCEEYLAEVKTDDKP